LAEVRLTNPASPEKPHNRRPANYGQLAQSSLLKSDESRKPAKPQVSELRQTLTKLAQIGRGSDFSVSEIRRQGWMFFGIGNSSQRRSLWEVD
jgi:hypothetical protein